MSTDANAPVEKLPVLLGLGELVDLFDPQVKKQTIYRWSSNSAGRERVLPPAEVTVSRSPIWREETILPFMAARGLEPNKKVLEEIRKSQGH